MAQIIAFPDRSHGDPVCPSCGCVDFVVDAPPRSAGTHLCERCPTVFTPGQVNEAWSHKAIARRRSQAGNTPAPDQTSWSAEPPCATCGQHHPSPA